MYNMHKSPHIFKLFKIHNYSKIIIQISYVQFMSLMETRAIDLKVQERIRYKDIHIYIYTIYIHMYTHIFPRIFM